MSESASASVSVAAAAYDHIAADYDQLVAGDAWMRRALQARYRRLFRPGQRVLDVGCGTGLDALALGRAGVRVLGVDASAAMLERARGSLAQAGLAEQVTLRQLDIADLGQLAATDGAAAFDGAISAFASLSSVADLAAAAGTLSVLVRPGGAVVVHLLNRFSSWEWLGLLARRDWSAAARLGRVRARAFTIGGQRLVHTLYAPHEAARVFTAAGFAVRRAYGFGALRPPHTVRRLPPWLVGGLEWADLRLGGLPPLAAAGRFFVLELERRATAG